jgi:hypothetical protein
MAPSRRHLLAAGGIAAGGLAAGPGRAAAAAGEAAALQAVLERYVGFGDKASGGTGDEACGAWLAETLEAYGYATARQAFEVPFFAPRTARLALRGGETQAEVIPQAIVVPTGPEGLTGPLKRADMGGDLAGAIALVVLPYKRWVTLMDPQAAGPLADAFKRGAAAAVLVTTGPTGEAIALNVSTHRPGPGRPVAVLAPRAAGPFLAAAAEGRPATLTLDGPGGRRQAWNLIARRERKGARSLIVSTPRSGWLGCAGERGSGLAVWLSLAESLAKTRPAADLTFVATSGHEYEYLGGEEFLAHAAPPHEPDRMWVHIGASAAARDWQEFGPVLRPLPSADAQRVLTATANVIEGVRPAFAGITGLEATLVADATTAGGELTNVLKAGYSTAIGLYGIHRYFHTRGDDLRCTSGELVAPVARAFRTAVGGWLKA